MNEVSLMNNHLTSAPDLQIFPFPDDQQIFHPSTSSFDNSYHKPRKKQRTTKSMTTSCSSSKPKKPDPAAPKITPPCTECGRKFWSWKALFGHMRCHPERQWRGINPPPNLRRPEVSGLEGFMTEEDHQIATCLLMLASGPAAESAQAHDCRFECSSCKKVFGSHQALGGHRASHKNVKGCFAINKTEGEEFDEGVSVNTENIWGRFEEEHKCGICFRVFSSGQALGGHKRSHWERGDDMLGLRLGSASGCGPDLNIPATTIEGDSGLGLDLRLGL